MIASASTQSLLCLLFFFIIKESKERTFGIWSFPCFGMKKLGLYLLFDPVLSKFDFSVKTIDGKARYDAVIPFLVVNGWFSSGMSPKNKNDASQTDA